MTEVMEAVSVVGFPIVCAGALFWYMVNVQDKMRATIEENTKIMTKIYTVLDALTTKKLDKED